MTVSLLTLSSFDWGSEVGTAFLINSAELRYFCRSICDGVRVSYWTIPPPTRMHRQTQRSQLTTLLLASLVSSWFEPGVHNAISSRARHSQLAAVKITKSQVSNSQPLLKSFLDTCPAENTHRENIARKNKWAESIEHSCWLLLQLAWIKLLNYRCVIYWCKHVYLKSSPVKLKSGHIKGVNSRRKKHLDERRWDKCEYWMEWSFMNFEMNKQGKWCVYLTVQMF